jgi:hypothetical protein
MIIYYTNLEANVSPGRVITGVPVHNTSLNFEKLKNKN